MAVIMMLIIMLMAIVVIVAESGGEQGRRFGWISPETSDAPRSWRRRALSTISAGVLPWRFSQFSNS